MELYYPNFPSEQELTHCILSSGNLQQQSEGGKLQLLTRIITEQQHLYVGGALLPNLVELYQWLHRDIAHLVTRQDASTITIGRVVELAESNSSKKLGRHIRDLYEKVKQGYNQYVQLIGGAIGAGACVAVRRGNKIYTITDDMPLLYFLSGT